MKVLVAIDSYKRSLSSLEAGNAACNLERTVEQVFRIVAKLESCRRGEKEDGIL